MRRPEVHARHVPIHRRGLLGLLLASLAGAMAFLALASPAVAFLRSFEMVIGQGTSDSSPVKDLVLSCPSDKSAIGTGASALSSSGEPITGVGLNTTQLVTPGTGAAGQVSWLRAVEADPEAVSWGLFGQVFCLAPTTQRPTSTGIWRCVVRCGSRQLPADLACSRMRRTRPPSPGESRRTPSVASSRRPSAHRSTRERSAPTRGPVRPTRRTRT